MTPEDEAYIEGLLLDGSVQSDTSDKDNGQLDYGNEAESLGPVESLHIPKEIWSFFMREQMRLLRENAQDSAAILLGRRNRNVVTVKERIYIEPQLDGGVLTDQEISGTVENCVKECFSRGDEMEVVGALVAGRRTRQQVEKLMLREPALQAVIVGYPIGVAVNDNSVIQNVAIFPYTIDQDGCIQDLN